MKYLVAGTEGPGFMSPEETVQILEKVVLPSFDALIDLEEQNKILGGGLPLGERAFVFIVEASSHEEVDRILRSLSVWGVLKWKVTPLQSFAGRAAQEREIIDQIKEGK